MDLARVQRLWLMADEYDDEAYDGPAWLAGRMLLGGGK
jgi:hypothetical protein